MILFKKKLIIGFFVVIAGIILIVTFIMENEKTKNEALNNVDKKSIASVSENNTNKSLQDNVNKADNSNINASSKSSENVTNTNTINSSSIQTNKSDTSNNTGKTSNDVSTASNGISPQQSKVPQNQNTLPAQSNQEQQSKSQTEVQKPVEKPAASVSPQKYIYNDLGFSITFPASWKGKYVLKKNENGLNVYFYSANHPEQAGSGRLFTIVNKASDVDESMLDTISGSQRYFTVKGITYVIGGPTDVGFPLDNPDYGLYMQLSNNRASVINSIKAIK